MTAAFLPGLELAAAFYAEVLAPALADVPHAAARVGPGSDVLGYDDARSTDHGWGPRAQIFVDAADVGRAERAVAAALPETFRGWPVFFGWDDVPTTAHVETTTLAAWCEAHLGFDATRGASVDDWLATPQQALLEATAGAVFHDGLGVVDGGAAPGSSAGRGRARGDLGRLRASLAWYPDAVWRCVLAAQWRRIAQEEAFVGRAAEVGDELGARLVTARLARDVVRLCFLLERKWAPYTKWLGTAFSRLPIADVVGPSLAAALDGRTAAAREDALLAALVAVGAKQNALGLVAPIDATPRRFHARPFRVIGAQRFADALGASIVDEALRARADVGAIDQLVDSTDATSSPSRVRRIGLATLDVDSPAVRAPARR